MKTLEKLSLQYAVNGVLSDLVADKLAARDPHDTAHQELAVRAALYDRWDQQVKTAASEILKATHILFQPVASDVDRYMQIFSKHLSGAALTDPIQSVAQQAVLQSFQLGKASVVSQFKKQTGKEPQAKAGELAGAMFGALFGLTESHALKAMQDQLTVAAGGMWDDQLSDSVKAEMESWFQGAITRDQLIDHLSTLVNERLATEGRSLARSYFDGLAEHIMVRSRNIGSYYQGKSLGAKTYKLQNPHDNRTSDICEAVTHGQVFHMAGAESVVSNIISATSLGELKATVPFYDQGTISTATGPVPPLHWRCRTWMEYVFAGLN